MADKKDQQDFYATQLKQYEDLVNTIPELERKGKTMPYTSVNGHMFSFLDKEGNLNIRLSEEERESFIKKYKTELSMQHGRIMKEYVVVPETLLKKTKELAPYFELSHIYTQSLKPKPTKKKK